MFENLPKKSHSKLRAKQADTQNILFQRVFENPILWSNSVTRQVNFKKTKIGGKCQNWKRTNTTFWVICKHCSNVHVEKKLKLHPPFSSSKLLFSSWSSGCPIDERIGHRRMQWLAQTGRTRMAGWPGYGCAMTSDAVPLLHNALASLWYTLGQKTPHFLSINSFEFDLSNNVIFFKKWDF